MIGSKLGRKWNKKKLRYNPSTLSPKKIQLQGQVTHLTTWAQAQHTFSENFLEVSNSLEFNTTTSRKIELKFKVIFPQSVK